MNLGAAGKGLMALLVIAVIISLVTLFSGKKPIGSEHLIGKRLPDFAAPLAGSGIDGGANVYTPAQAKANDATAACDVQIAGSMNSCDDLKGAAVVLFWNADKKECVEQVDRLQAVLRNQKQVNSVAVAFGNSMGAATAAKNKHGWKLPVAVDDDGALAALYSVAGCPSTFFAKDGVIRGVKLGLQSTAELEAEIKRYTGG